MSCDVSSGTAKGNQCQLLNESAVVDELSHSDRYSSHCCSDTSQLQMNRGRDTHDFLILPSLTVFHWHVVVLWKWCRSEVFSGKCVVLYIVNLHVALTSTDGHNWTSTLNSHFMGQLDHNRPTIHIFSETSIQKLVHPPPPRPRHPLLATVVGNVSETYFNPNPSTRAIINQGLDGDNRCTAKKGEETGWSRVTSIVNQNASSKYQTSLCLY